MGKQSKYSLEIIKDDEALMMLETSIHNGSSAEIALEDLHMIDTLLHMKKLHFVVHGEVKKTKRGHFRKGELLRDAMMDVVEGFAKKY